MKIPTQKKQLTALFRKLGSRSAEGWASSQINEGIPQLQRFLFLRQAWEKVIREEDESWIDQQVEHCEKSPDAPHAGVGIALKECMRRGVPRQALTDIARGVQAQLLFQLCYLLDDPGFAEPELEGFAWGLFETDDDDRPIGERIGGLYESVLDTDPTGREMRPRED